MNITVVCPSCLKVNRIPKKDSYAKVKNGELFLYGSHISPYPNASFNNHEPERIRKLLLHKREIKRLIGKTKEKGYSLIPLRLYFRGDKVKVELALAKGKRKYDKRETLKRREEERALRRIMRKKF
jgi:SsrA-binding protein